MDSTLRQRLPPVFSQYVSVDTLQESRLTSEHYAQMSTVDRCRAIMGVVNESEFFEWRLKSCYLLGLRRKKDLTHSIISFKYFFSHIPILFYKH